MHPIHRPPIWCDARDRFRPSRPIDSWSRIQSHRLDLTVHTILLLDNWVRRFLPDANHSYDRRWRSMNNRAGPSPTCCRARFARPTYRKNAESNRGLHRSDLTQRTPARHRTPEPRQWSDDILRSIPPELSCRRNPTTRCRHPRTLRCMARVDRKLHECQPE